MIHRSAAATLQKLAKAFPVVTVTGPRQSGKTTLVRSVFLGRSYASLEDPDERDLAEDDPRGFLGRFPDGAVLDEVQRAPALLSYLQGIVDRDGRSGLFVLTGSQHLGLLSSITQSLAGRVGLLELLPFSSTELEGARALPRSIEELLFRGLYPPIYDRDVEPRIWYANYVRTYVERDVRQIVNVRDLTSFQRFLRMCASRTGQLLNLSGLGDDCGVTHNTAKAWLSVLQASYVLVLLPPHHRNLGKRLVKAPKLHFLDPGLAAYLVGVRDPEELRTHALRGHLFESWVVAELLKSRFNSGLPSDLFFWRDRSGAEVDVIVDQGRSLRPIEIKSGRTISADQFAGLERWMGIAGRHARSPALVYAGDEALTRKGVEIVPWRDVGRLLS